LRTEKYEDEIFSGKDKGPKRGEDWGVRRRGSGGSKQKGVRKGINRRSMRILGLNRLKDSLKGGNGKRDEGNRKGEKKGNMREAEVYKQLLREQRPGITKAQ